MPCRIEREITSGDEKRLRAEFELEIGIGTTLVAAMVSARNFRNYLHFGISI